MQQEPPVCIHLFLVLANRLGDTARLLIISVSNDGHRPNALLTYHGSFPLMLGPCTHHVHLPIFPAVIKRNGKLATP